MVRISLTSVAPVIHRLVVVSPYPALGSYRSAHSVCQTMPFVSSSTTLRNTHCWKLEKPLHHFGGCPVLSGLEVRVGPERGATTVAVADATRDSSYVHPGRDQLGDQEVAQVMEPALDSEAAGQGGEALGYAVGPDRSGAVGLVAEHIGIG
jgi:hypothetical protein